MIDVDFGKHADDYARHRAGFPASFFRVLDAFGMLDRERAILDVGTGTGTIARGLAKLGFELTGLDPSQALLDQAIELSTTEGLSIRYRKGKAEDSGLPSQSFGCVTAGQCWHWFQHERACEEIKRLLSPNGLLLVAYFDWIQDPNSNCPVALMQELRRKYNPDWRSEWPLGFYPQGPEDLNFAGFSPLAAVRYREDVLYTHAGWRGRMRAYAGIGGSLPKEQVDAFDREFAAELKSRFPQEPMPIPHQVWASIWQRQN